MKTTIYKSNCFFHYLSAGAAVWLFSLSVAQSAPRTLISEPFEGVPTVAWQHNWGKAANSTERAHGGKQALKCTVEDKYGMSVHWYNVPVKAGATYTLTAAVFIPVQDKECFPVLWICITNWGLKAGATPTKKGEWEELRCQWTNTENLKTIRVALHNKPWKAGLGGAVYFWDDIVLTEDGGSAGKPEAAGSGGKIAAKLKAHGRNPAALAGLAARPAGGMKVKGSAAKARVPGREVAVAETL